MRGDDLVNATGAQAICVCACTYKRPEGLQALLDGLGRQAFTAMARPGLHVVIADNEGSEQARGVCADFERRTGIPLTYVHEPERGISFARNACLYHIPTFCDFFAFIDDDEVPEPDWLERMLDAQAETGADVVQGPVIPVFGEGAPQWLVAGDFLGWPRRGWPGIRAPLEEFQELTEAYTNNVLARRESVASIGLRFDPRFALTGGGDTIFFRALHAAGNRIVYAPRARVTELVPPERATLWYRLCLEYRIANNRLPERALPRKRKLWRRMRQRWRASGLARIFSGIGYFVRSGLTGQLNMDRTVVASLRIASGLGRSARALGLKYHPYR